MEWVSGWIQGIIIAVIISTIIEMILPEGNSKKYIKVVIGVYILFSIVSPVISKLTGSDFRVSDIFDLDEYIETSKNSSSLQNQLAEQNESQIKEIYLSSMKNDIKEKIENKGYAVNSMEIEVEDDEQYTLKKIGLQISKTSTDTSANVETNNTNQTVEIVDEIKIEVSNTQNNVTSNTNLNSSTTKKGNITSQEKKQLKEYLSGVYEISTENIFINQ